MLLALNLRAAVGSLGVVLEPVRESLALSAPVAGALTTLPVICFAIFGALSPAIVRRIGLNRTAFALLVVIAAALVARAAAESGAAFVALTVVALAAAGVGNVILPALTKQHAPDHIPTVSALYGAALLGGAALSSGLTVPLSESGLGWSDDGWRFGLGAWAVLALIAAVPWITTLRHDVHVRVRSGSSLRWSDVARSPLAWALALTFGFQSAAAYAQFGWYASMLDEAGLSAGHAGGMLGVLSAAGLPVALLLPRLLAWAGSRPILPVAFATATIAGWLGILLAPTTVPWLWSLLLGIGGGLFPWTLTMIGRRSATVDGTAALSGFVQGIGYSIAAAGPFGVGVLHGATGNFNAAIVALIGGAVAMGAAGTWVMRCGMLEDDLRPVSRP